MSTILYLGPWSPLIGWLKDEGYLTVRTEDPIRESIPADFLVSYNYRHKIPPNVLEAFPRRAINLHISYLPWNKGSYPNVFSFVEGTPKGVTIHYLDNGFDTGDIIAQQEFQPDYERDTLKTTYDKLHFGIQELFKREWSGIWAGTCSRTPQPEGGSSHKLADLERYRYLLTQGWDTPVKDLAEVAGEIQDSVQFWEKA